MLRPESVAKSEVWLRAASASFWTDNMQEWIAEQSPKVTAFLHRVLALAVATAQPQPPCM